MNDARMQRDDTEDQLARLAEARQALIDLELRHRQITRRYGEDPAPGWADGVREAMGTLGGFLAAEKATQQTQWQAAHETVRQLRLVKG